MMEQCFDKAINLVVNMQAKRMIIRIASERVLIVSSSRNCGSQFIPLAKCLHTNHSDSTIIIALAP